MRNIFIVVLLFTAILLSCKGRKRKVVESQVQYELVKMWETDTLFKVPESVIYDEKRNCLYLTNLNLGPRRVYNDGYISKLDLNGNVIELKWVYGVDYPTGITIANDKLYVSEFDVIAEIDIDEQKIVKRIPIEGITASSDITSDKDGNLYVSDSESNKIFRYSNGEMSVWMDQGLDSPGGLLVDNDRMLVASSFKTEISSVDIATKKKSLITNEIETFDGMVSIGIPGHFLVTNLSGGIFLLYPDNSLDSLMVDKKIDRNGPDISFVPSQSMILIPTIYHNTLTAYKLERKAVQEGKEEIQ